MKTIRTLALLVTVGATLTANAVLINFDDQGLTGPSTFAAAGPMQVRVILAGGNVATFSGGVILENTSNLPANSSALYGTAYFGADLLNPLTISFDDPIKNFVVDVYNGETTDRTFKVWDELGNSALFTLPSNLSSGETQVYFGAAGKNISIADTGTDGSWDFFIDNIQFDVPLPTVPDAGSSSLLLLCALSLLGLRRNRES